MPKYAELFSTSQTQPIKGEKHKQAKNNAGGFAYKLDMWKRLERFLILGSDSNTMYQKAPEITKENAKVVIECWETDPSLTADTIRTISVEGRAPRNSPAIFALALGCISKTELVRKHAHLQIPLVCRTSTHLFEFVATYDKLGGKGFGRGMKRAIASWYENKTDDQLAYQLVKYRQREGYTHTRLIKRARPKKTSATSNARSCMFDWLCGREVPDEALPSIITAHRNVIDVVREGAQIDAICNMVVRERLPWEALPTWANAQPEIWRNMLPTMPLNALIRNLGNMTRLGVFNDDGISTTIAMNRITNDKVLKYARIHPFNLLNGLKTYSEGHGFRGDNSWNPVRPITQALEVAFYKSFQFVEPTNKRICLAFDISPSMDNAKLFNSSLSAREASSAMAMATLASEPDGGVARVAFSSDRVHNYLRGGGSLVDVRTRVRKGLSLSEIIQYTRGLPYSGTDCSLPITEAMRENALFDAFIIYTDNETFAGSIHPSEALRQYRQASGISDAKLIVVGMTSNGFSIADPDDANMLDVVGFSSDTPAVISSFLRGSHDLSQSNIRATSEEDELS